MTLLEAFINNFINEYQEPERKGVQHGDEIGIFSSRFKSLLFSLYGIPQKEIAKKVGISYSFFRRIKSEEDLDSHINEFSDIFIEDCLFLYTSTGSYYPRNYSDLPAISQETAFEINIEEAFLDSAKYCKVLKRKIANVLIEKVDNGIGVEATDKKELVKIVESLNRILKLLATWNEPEFNKQIFKVVSKKCNEQICKILKSDEITDSMRNHAIICSDFILKFSNIL